MDESPGLGTRPRALFAPYTSGSAY